MITMTVNVRTFQWAFSLNKQGSLLTPIASGNIDQMLPQRGFAPFMQQNPNVVTDRQWYGKGRTFPTFRDTVTKELVIPSREFSMTQLSALFAPAFVLGSLTSSQPDAGHPTVWRHSMQFQDPTTSPSVLFTSMIEKAGSEYQKKISGAYISSFAVKAARTDHVVISWQGGARKAATDATSMPSLATAQSYFKLIKAFFSFGAVSAQTTQSANVLEFNLTANQNPQQFWLPGAASGDESILSKVLIGDQTLSGDITFFLTSALRDFFLNQTECALTLVFDGDQIGTTGYNYQVTATIPHLKISSEAFADVETTTSYKMTFDEGSVLKNASDPFFTWMVQTDVADTALLVTA
jgi:hypothetical protein